MRRSEIGIGLIELLLVLVVICLLIIAAWPRYIATLRQTKTVLGSVVSGPHRSIEQLGSGEAVVSATQPSRFQTIAQQAAEQVGQVAVVPAESFSLPPPMSQRAGAQPTSSWTGRENSTWLGPGGHGWVSAAESADLQLTPTLDRRLLDTWPSGSENPR